MAKQEYVIEGANFMAVVLVEVELCGCPYLEAATLVLEKAFGNGPFVQKKDGFQLMVKHRLTPAVSKRMFVWKNGDIGNDKKMKVINTREAALNAGRLDLAQFLETV